MADVAGKAPCVESRGWLAIYKDHTGVKSIAYEDSVREALCFGWIDSLIKRLDDDRYARKFTPRQRTSKWSDINRERWVELKAAGLLTAAGVRHSDSLSEDAKSQKNSSTTRRGFGCVRTTQCKTFGLGGRYQEGFCGLGEGLANCSSLGGVAARAAGNSTRKTAPPSWRL
jgi:hypothetical protein